jgi:hypothetical protein
MWVNMTILQEYGFKTSPDGIVVVQQDGDRGDSPQKTSMAHIGLIANDSPLVKAKMEFMEAYQYNWLKAYGELCRDKTGIWNDPNDFSRDQHDPVVIALGLYGEIEEARKRMRWFKYQNKDIGGPLTWALNIRAGLYFLAWPLLWVFDLQILIGSIVMAFDTNPDSVDDDNHLCRLVQAMIVFPTPISWLSRKIYVNLRPGNYGTSFKKERNPIMGALAWKHRLESGGNPAMVELWRPIVMRWTV